MDAMVDTRPELDTKLEFNTKIHITHAKCARTVETRDVNGTGKSGEIYFEKLSGQNGTVQQIFFLRDGTGHGRKLKRPTGRDGTFPVPRHTNGYAYRFKKRNDLKKT